MIVQKDMDCAGVKLNSNREPIDNDDNDDDERSVAIVEELNSPSEDTKRLHPSAAALRRETSLPLLQSLALAAMYILYSMFYFLAIRYTKRRGTYNNAMVVFCIEVLKLFVSVALKYREDGEFLPYVVLFGTQRRRLWRSGLPYAIPSLLYAIYNNLTFYNLNLFDPGTYQLFMQTRILFTGVLFSIVLRHALSVRKWCALFVLTLGVACKYYSPSTIELDGHVFVMLFQALLSSLAGVYNEYALKKEMHLSIHQQNFFMYLYAIGLNVLFGILTDPAAAVNFLSSVVLRRGSGNPGTDVAGIATTAAPPQQENFLLMITIIIFCGAATGLCAAFILKFINGIVKTFASAVEVLLTAVMASLLLGEKLTSGDVFAALIVMISVSIYYTSGCGDSKLISFR